MNAAPAPGALAGTTVIDLSRFIAGPLCAQMLGDMGAEVVKVERPGGEDARRLGPFHDGASLYTMQFNRNKQGATLDTRHPRALTILEDLVRRADVVVENFRPGTMAAMGLSWDRIHELNPRTVLVSISGFGQTGPAAGRALFDAIAQAESGLMSMTGDPDVAPTLTGAFLADYVAGYHGAIGALLALLHRGSSGEGQLVDVASVDALFSTLGTAPSDWAMHGVEAGRNGSRDRLSGPANLFRTRDAWIYMHAGTDPLFARLATMIERPDLVDDPRFSGVAARMDHIEAIEDVVAEWFARQDRASASAALTAAGIPFGNVATVGEVTDADQTAARRMMLDVDHPTLGTLALPGIPIKLSATPGTVRKAPPEVGEDNAWVYGDLLGYSPETIDALRTEHVI